MIYFFPKSKGLYRLPKNGNVEKLVTAKNSTKLLILKGAYKLLNQETKENYQMKMDKELEQIQAMRSLGIVWISLGVINPMFFILGLVFIISSMVKSKRREADEGGHA